MLSTDPDFKGLVSPQVVEEKINFLKEKQKQLTGDIHGHVVRIIEKRYPDFNYKEIEEALPEEIQNLEEKSYEIYNDKIQEKIRKLEILSAELN